MLSVFGDESADETKQRVIAVGGVIGNEELWRPLDTKWRTRTQGIPFHAKDCDSDRGDYSKNEHQDNKALYRDLTAILAESRLGGWGFAIDLAAQRRIFPDGPDIAYYKCFLEVLQAMKNCAANNNETVKFTFDLRKESEYNATLLYEAAAASEQGRNHMFPKITFEESRSNSRIQVADLFVHEAMKALDNHVGPKKREPRKSWLALHRTQRFHIDVVSAEYFESLKQQMPALETLTGMSRNKYLEWLKEKNRQHNTTNLFLYSEDSKGKSPKS